MASIIDYESVLNSAQLEAVMTLEGPVLVIAGAGSGKTRTLVYRVARLVERGVPPESILLLTFTRKAAQEMLERAAGLSDPRCRFVSGGTFHSLALKTLRTYVNLLGMDHTFSVLDRSDMEEVIQSLVPELAIPKGSLRFPKRSTLANMLSKAANLQRPIEHFIADEYGQFMECATLISRLGELYTAYKKTHQMMDYDDLILNLRRLLERKPEVREALTRQYSYVMVDEYQDTNTIQADIVKWLAHEHRNIMVVGDDSQSIYSFRGANYRNMFDFPRHFPEVKTIKLEENYRSTQPILTFTNALMDRASEQFTKCLFTRRQGGVIPQVVDTRTEPEQAMFVTRYVLDQAGQGRPMSDTAVLFRASYHAFELEAELTRQGIPYVKYGGFKFLESAHIKDFLAHLRVLVNTDEVVSWVRVLRLIRNVGQAKTQALIGWMRGHQIPPHQIAKWPEAGKRESGLKALAGLLADLNRNNVKPRDAVEQVMDYYDPILKEKFDDYNKRKTELQQLIPMAGRYRKLRSFLDDLVLEPPTSSADLDPEQKADVLTLSTVHSAKGLEWSSVLVIWVMEGRFPASRAYNNPLDLEEERRLMYVAATRAKDQLIMCYPGQESMPSWSSYADMDWGVKPSLSPFIRGLPGDVVSYELSSTHDTIPRKRRQNTRPPVQNWTQRSSSGLSPGDKVTHPAFGAGVVSKLIGDDKIEVLFRDEGRKLLHLAYTTLEKA